MQQFSNDSQFLNDSLSSRTEEEEEDLRAERRNCNEASYYGSGKFERQILPLTLFLLPCQFFRALFSGRASRTTTCLFSCDANFFSFFCNRGFDHGYFLIQAFFQLQALLGIYSDPISF